MRVALFILLVLVASTEAFVPAHVPAKPAFTSSTTCREMAPRNDPPTAATPVKAVGFLGAAAACLGLIVAAPFANVDSPGVMAPRAPKEIVQKVKKVSDKPKKEKVVKEKKQKVVKEEAPKKEVDEKVNRSLKRMGYDF